MLSFLNKKTRNKLFLSPLFNIVLETLDSTFKQEKKLKNKVIEKNK